MSGHAQLVAGRHWS